MAERAAVIADGARWTARALARAARALALPDGAVAIPSLPALDAIMRVRAALDRGRGFRLVDPRAPADDDPGAIADDEIVVATSGTTGRAKGVRLPRAAFAASAHGWRARLGLDGDDRCLLALPLAHVGGLGVVLRGFLAGATVVVAPPGPFVAAAAADLIARAGVTLASLVPTQLHRLLAADWRPPPSLRAVVVGGASASPSLLAEAAARGVPVVTTYGLSEACGTVALDGRPLDGVEVRVVDGAVEVRGPTLMRGYLGGAPSPIRADGWLATGDLGRLDGDGRLHVLGRRDDLIVTGGEKVHPAEVERALLAAPIAAACVFGVPDEEWGAVVAAALVAPSPPDDAALARALAALPPWQRPRRIAWLPSLPQNALGKVDRAAVAAAARPSLRPLRRG